MRNATHEIVGLVDGAEVDFSDRMPYGEIQREIAQFMKLAEPVEINRTTYTHYFKENGKLTYLRIRDFA